MNIITIFFNKIIIISKYYCIFVLSNLKKNIMQLYRYNFMFLIVFTLTFNLLNAQENTSDTTIYTNPDKPASYKGGEWAKIKFINKHLVYPQKAKEEKTEGRVKVEMIVEKDGSLSDIKIVRSLSPECDAEIKRVVALMPKWKPAYHQKQAVRSLTSFSVFYILPDK